MTFLLASLLATAPQDSSLDKFVYPLSAYRACPPVRVDTSDLPSARAWGDKAKGLVETWFPQICQLLSTSGYKTPKTITLIIKKTLNVPAYESNDSITINGDWITRHPDDLGMVVHELTHVVQSYPDSDSTPGWLVEGIADYVRWWRYEPEVPRSHIDVSKAKYTDAYRTTAWWLAWVSQKYDRRLVPALDLAIRNRQDPMPVFKSLTGKDPDTLWQEFIKTPAVLKS